MCGLFVFVFAALGVSRHSGGRRHRSKKIFDRRSCVHVSASPITIISHLPTYLPTSIMIRALYVPLALGALLAFAAPARTSELQFKGGFSNLLPAQPARFCRTHAVSAPERAFIRVYSYRRN